MAKRFKISDHVSWNSEAGRVSGTITAIHTKDFHYKSHVRHASKDDPQYEIKSDKTVISQPIRAVPLNMHVAKATGDASLLHHRPFQQKP
jgi:Hypervirulence associated proteins TUDOR domain